ncbi:hypothetical protein U9M48_002094, partial [Paspalum notatum var. saurae]
LECLPEVLLAEVVLAEAVLAGTVLAVAWLAGVVLVGVAGVALALLVVVVLKNFELRKLILDESHNSQFAIHPGSNKMYQDLKQRFWWTRMKREIARYISECDACQRVKAKHLKLAGTLQPLPITSWKWENISMDFITRLPKTRDGYDSIWVIVDRLTKSAHFLPCLPFAEFSYNNSYQASIGMSPFEMLYGRNCRSPVNWSESGERQYFGPDLVLEAEEKVRLIQERLRNAQLAPRFVGPFKIMAKIGQVAYRLDLPSSLSSIDNVFHVSQLRKCIRVPTKVTNLEEIDLQPNLVYQEHPIRILDQAERKTRNKTTKFVKVQWSRHSEWETYF